MFLAPLEKLHEGSLELTPPNGLLLLEAIVPELFPVIVHDCDIKDHIIETIDDLREGWTKSRIWVPAAFD